MSHSNDAGPATSALGKTQPQLSKSPGDNDLPVCDLDLERLQRTTIHYYLHETNPYN